MEAEVITWSEFFIGGKATVDRILGLEEIIKSKRAQLIKSQSGILVKRLIIWVRSSEIEKLYHKNYNSDYQLSQFQQNGSTVLLMDLNVSKDKYISRLVDWENLIYVKSNLCEHQRLRTKKRILINKAKISKTPTEVKPVKNVNMNHQIFLGISPCKAMYMSNKILLN